MNIHWPDEIRKRNDKLIEKIKKADDPLLDRQLLNSLMVKNKDILKSTYKFLFNNFNSFDEVKQFKILILINIFFFTNVKKEISNPDFEFLEFIIGKLLSNEKYFNYGLVTLHLFIQRFTEYQVYLFIGKLRKEYQKQLFDIIIDGIINDDYIEKDPENFYSILHDISLGPAFYFYTEDLNYIHFFNKIFGYDFIKQNRDSIIPYKSQISDTLKSNIDKIFKKDNLFMLLKSVYLLFYNENDEFFKEIDDILRKNMKNVKNIQKILDLTIFLKEYYNHPFFNKFYKDYFNMVRQLSVKPENIHIIGEMLQSFNIFSIDDLKKEDLIVIRFFRQLLKDLEFFYRSNESTRLNEVYQQIESLIYSSSKNKKILSVNKSYNEEKRNKELFPTAKAGHVNASNSFDLLLIFPLKEEFKVFKEICKIKSTITKDGLTYYFLDFPISNLSGIAIVLHEMGPTRASQITEKSLNLFDVRLVVLIGIAGALDEDLKLGDIVIANEVSEFFASSKVEDEGVTFKFKYSGEHWRQKFSIDRCIKNFDINNEILFQEWQNTVIQYVKDLNVRMIVEPLLNKNPNYYVGHIASSNIVVASKIYKIELLGIDRRFLIIEMEAAGVESAVHNREHPIDCIIIRGISDFADERKKDLERKYEKNLRKYAMYSAIQFFLYLIKTECFEKMMGKTLTNISETKDYNKVIIRDKAFELLKKVNNINNKISEILPDYLEFLQSLNDKEEIKWVSTEISGSVERDYNKKESTFSYRKIRGYISASEIQHQGYYTLENFVQKYPRAFLEHSIITAEPILEIEIYEKYKEQKILYFKVDNGFFYTEILEFRKVLNNIRNKISKILINHIG